MLQTDNALSSVLADSAIGPPCWPEVASTHMAHELSLSGSACQRFGCKEEIRRDGCDFFPSAYVYASVKGVGLDRVNKKKELRQAVPVPLNCNADQSSGHGDLEACES